MTVEEKLRELITSRYGTMIDFSRKVNISNSTLSSIMTRGVHNASINNVIKICKALGISADGLANNEIIPVEVDFSNNIQDISELTSFVKITVSSNKNLTIDGKPLTEDDIQIYIDSMVLCSELIKKRVERRQKTEV